MMRINGKSRINTFGSRRVSDVVEGMMFEG